MYTYQYRYMQVQYKIKYIQLSMLGTYVRTSLVMGLITKVLLN